ncbi:hypothetical protein HYV21_00485 [Candidatus Microgenomates bacterium]|nr:hypothetical protein [Candidatus Microgenomates bacterium]
MTNISIFARKARPHQRDGHLWRVSSIIRGWQIAERIGAKLNPADAFEHDVCIYVKPHVGPGNDFAFAGKPYLDIIDGWQLLHLAREHPEVTVIACSQVDYEYVSQVVTNKVILIPQHHCNFERVKRSRNGITTVGCIGTSGAFQWLPEGLKERLKERGMNLIEFSQFYTRQDIIDFYRKIDVQIVWRPYVRQYGIKLGNPLKLINAASFGIPTIALQEHFFKEMEGYYLPVHTLDEFLAQLDLLRSSSSMYIEYSKKCLKKAEEYHIENVTKLYQALT